MGMGMFRLWHSSAKPVVLDIKNIKNYKIILTNIIDYYIIIKPVKNQAGEKNIGSYQSDGREVRSKTYFGLSQQRKR